MTTGAAEVVVIGGGIIGCSIAYYLAKEGVDISLVERAELASGSSSAGQGAIVETTPLTLRSAKLYSTLTEELDYNIEYNTKGSLRLIEREDQWPRAVEFVKKQQKQGIKIRLLKKNELKELAPFVAEDIIGAIDLPLHAQVNPIYTTLGFAYAARRLGARICTFTEVKDIRTRNSQIQSVVTNEGEIKTKFVVNAAGVQAPRIGEMVGLSIPIKPRRGQILVTEAIPLVAKRSDLSEFGPYELIRELSPETAKKSKDPLIRLGIAWNLIQTENGNCLIGTSREFAGFNQRTTPEVIKALAKKTIRFIPRLKDVSCIRTYAGLRQYTDDLLPIWGKVDSVKGFVIVAGHEGEGISLAPIAGKLISELITKDKTSIPIDKYNYSRFKNKNSYGP